MQLRRRKRALRRLVVSMPLALFGCGSFGANDAPSGSTPLEAGAPEGGSAAATVDAAPDQRTPVVSTEGGPPLAPRELMRWSFENGSSCDPWTAPNGGATKTQGAPPGAGDTSCALCRLTSASELYSPPLVEIRSGKRYRLLGRGTRSGTHSAALRALLQLSGGSTAYESSPPTTFGGEWTSFGVDIVTPAVTSPLALTALLIVDGVATSCVAVDDVVLTEEDL